MKLLHSVVIACLILSACSKETSFKAYPDGPIKHHLIALAYAQKGVRARGFSGATPANTQVFCEVGKARLTVTSASDGSFVVDLPDADTDIKAGEFTFTLPDKTILQQGYQIRDLPSSLRTSFKEPFATDKEVDAIDLVGDEVAILSSQASLVRTFVVDNYFRLGEDAQSAQLLNNPPTVPLYPSSVALTADHIVVPLNLAHEVALVGRKPKSFSRSKVEDGGTLFRFTLTTPLTVANPLDADESGIKTTVINRSIARNPETIMALDAHHFLVAFSNYYQFEDATLNQKSVVGPGVLAIMTIEDGKLTTKAHEILDYKNPRYFVKKDDNTIWVVCSGAWSNLGSDNLTSTDAGLVRVTLAANRASLSVDRRIALSNFAPTIIALVKDKLVIPRSDSNEIAVLDENATSLNDSHKKSANFHRPFGFTFAMHWHDDIVFLGDKKGTLVAYSLNDGFFPFPFVEPVIIDVNVDERVGLRPQRLLFRHQAEGYDITAHRQGFDAWLVTDTQQKIYPMVLEVFGP